MISKIGLGTVQFGLPYGIANRSGQTSIVEVLRILKYAKEVGINTLDTSCAYGESENVIGAILSSEKNDFNIVTKFSAQCGSVESVLKSSLKRLKVSSVYGYLVHQFGDFKDSPKIWGSFEQLKMQKKVRKIGFSLYLPEELEWLLKKKIIPDLIQIPYSVFDRRFEPYLGLLKKNGVEVHTRSVFLQGLVYLRPEELSGNLKKARIPLEKLQAIASNHNLSVGALCLNAVLSDPLVDKVIVGVDRLKQLKENVRLIKDVKVVEMLRPQSKKLAIQDENLLLPYKWRNE